MGVAVAVRVEVLVGTIVLVRVAVAPVVLVGPVVLVRVAVKVGGAVVAVRVAVAVPGVGQPLPGRPVTVTV